MAGVDEVGDKVLIFYVANWLDLGTSVSLLVPAAGTLSSDLSCIRLLIALYLSAMNESPSIW